VLTWLRAKDGALSSYESVEERGQNEILVEDALAAELTDREIVFATGDDGGWKYANPLVCDNACRLLAKQWPSKYRFVQTASRRKMDAECLSNLNIWRINREQKNRG
jgi:hypothetical protein